MCDNLYSIQNLDRDCSVDGKLCCQVQLAGGTLYHYILYLNFMYLTLNLRAQDKFWVRSSVAAGAGGVQLGTCRQCILWLEPVSELNPV